MFLLAMFAYILRRENIATPPIIYLFSSTKYLYINISVFVNEFFNKCYTNISDITKSKSDVDTFFAQTSP